MRRVNATTTGGGPHLPFGGDGLSGLGPCEQGRATLEFFARWRTLSVPAGC